MPNDEEIPGYGYTGIDPTDLALFGGLRASLPISALLYSKEANAGTDYERFAQQRAYEMAMAERQRDEQIRRAIALREKQQLDARIPVAAQNWYINRNYDPATATRRVDYERPPARNFGSPGTEMRAAPRRFQKGGSAKKTLQQMMDELLVRGAKTATKDTPDIGRRALFGLRPQQDLPLAKIHPDIEKATESRLTKALKDAPQVTEKSVEVNPATGSIKSTLQSVAGTPLSRRTVLSATAGQALRHMIPGLDALAPGVSDVAKVADTVVKAAAPAFTMEMVPALIGEAIRKGMSEKQAVAHVRSLVPAAEDKFELDDLYQLYKNPETFNAEDDLLRPGDVMRGYLGGAEEAPLMSMRPQIREMKQRAPGVYGDLKQYSRDISGSSIENAFDNGVIRSDEEAEMFMRNDPKFWEMLQSR